MEKSNYEELLQRLSKNLPNRKMAEYYSKITGKPTAEIYGQGIFYLVEVEDIDFEIAKKLMNDNWDN